MSTHTAPSGTSRPPGQETPPDTAPAASGRNRYWRIPPPVLTGPEDPGPEGLAILEEFTGVLGLALWRQLRALRAWIRAQTPEERRDLVALDRTRARRRLLDRLTDPEAPSGQPDGVDRGWTPGDDDVVPPGQGDESVPGESERKRIAGLLEALLHLPPGPGARDPAALARACEEVADWARTRCGLHTALEYRQVAALLEPDDADRALAVFGSARELAQFSRAEAWFHRVVGLARRARSWDTYTRAYLAHGTMALRTGRVDQARRSFLKALRRARREGLRLRAGQALQRLLVLNYRARTPELGDQRAAEALERLRDHLGQLRSMAEELAFAWLDDGDPAPAARLLDALSTPRIQPGRSGMTGALARASALLRDRAGFDDARLRLRRLPDDVELSSAWLDVARGAVLLGDEEAMEDALHRACTVARHRWAGWIRDGAESVRQWRLGEPGPPLAPDPGRTERRLALADAVTGALFPEGPPVNSDPSPTPAH